jgi:hypothetical protein
LGGARRRAAEEKKLIAVARAIARGDAGGSTEDEDEEDDGTEAFEQFGGEVAKAMARLRETKAEAPSSEIEVWEENWPAVAWFLALLTQWHRLAQSGMPAGLDYAAAREVARMQRIKVTPELFADLQTLELAYVQECVRRWPKPGSRGT